MLLNKSVLGLAKLAPTEESRYSLGAVCVEKECSIVTNGHYLVTVGNGPTTDNAIAAYPTIPAEPIKPGSGSILVSRDACLGALKAIKAIGKRLRHLSILHNAALTAEKLYVNTMDSVSAFTYKTEGTFPNWRAVIPTGQKPQAEITVSADYLRTLADYILEHCENGHIASVRLTVYASDKPLRFDARTSDGCDVTALLMPLRAESSQFAVRPDAEPEAEPEQASKAA